MESTSADRVPVLREQLAALGLTPRKSRGQNFLHDRRIVERIADVAELQPTDTVLEIGPGLGILTAELAKRVQRVVAVEVDSRLAEHLRRAVAANVELVEADALTIDPPELAGCDYVVVANLPYSVANAILRRLQEADPPPRCLTIMVQREVGERICARPPHMSLLSVAVQFFGTPRIMFRVGSGAFIPAPSVDSVVVRIVSHAPPLAKDEHRAFFSIVAAGFGQRRKQLANALSAGLVVERDVVTRALERADVSPHDRAQRLTVDDWVRLYQSLQSVRAGG